jgi:hypothetical protein
MASFMGEIAPRKTRSRIVRAAPRLEPLNGGLERLSPLRTAMKIVLVKRRRQRC